MPGLILPLSVAETFQLLHCVSGMGEPVVLIAAGMEHQDSDVDHQTHHVAGAASMELVHVVVDLLHCVADMALQLSGHLVPNDLPVDLGPVVVGSTHHSELSLDAMAEQVVAEVVVVVGVDDQELFLPICPLLGDLHEGSLPAVPVVFDGDPLGKEEREEGHHQPGFVLDPFQVVGLVPFQAAVSFPFHLLEVHSTAVQVDMARQEDETRDVVVVDQGEEEVGVVQTGVAVEEEAAEEEMEAELWEGVVPVLGLIDEIHHFDQTDCWVDDH